MILIPSIVIAAALGFFLLVRLLESRLIFVPPRYPEGFDVLVPSAGAEELWITTGDGVRLNGWYWAHPTSSRVLVWFHGNAENVGQGLALLPVLCRLGASVLAIDYRGYGQSEGHPSEEGVYRDADAAYEYLVRERGFRPRDVVLYGYSLGGAVAIDLASRRPCGGLIVQSSFTSVPAMARRLFHLPLVGFAARSRFDSARKIKRTRAPILVAHGTEDATVPLWMGQRLYEAAPEPRTFIPVAGAGHDDVMLVGGERYLEELRMFIEAAPARLSEPQIPSPR